MHAKYQVAMLKIAKVIGNVKVFEWTDRQTDRQSDGQQFNRYVPSCQGHISDF
jgi:hypothetical protein